MRDDIDFNDEPPPTDTNKFLHLAAEDMEVTSLTETVLSPTKIASIEGKLWLYCTSFRTLHRHLLNVPTFSKAATTTIRETSTSITNMIKELSQPGDPEVLIIDTRGPSMSAMDVVERSSLPEDSYEELPSPIPQPGEI